MPARTTVASDADDSAGNAASDLDASTQCPYLDFLYGELSIWRAVPMSVLSLCLFFPSSLRPDPTSFRYQMVFANFYLEIVTPYTLCDV
jgi:hypothetical protein